MKIPIRTFTSWWRSCKVYVRFLSPPPSLRVTSNPAPRAEEVKGGNLCNSEYNCGLRSRNVLRIPWTEMIGLIEWQTCLMAFWVSGRPVRALVRGRVWLSRPCGIDFGDQIISHSQEEVVH